MSWRLSALSSTASMCSPLVGFVSGGGGDALTPLGVWCLVTFGSEGDVWDRSGEREGRRRGVAIACFAPSSCVCETDGGGAMTESRVIGVSDVGTVVAGLVKGVVKP